MTYRRFLSIFIALCLIFTQTAQAYSLARLPHKPQRIAAYNTHTETLATDGYTFRGDGSLNDNIAALPGCIDVISAYRDVCWASDSGSHA